MGEKPDITTRVYSIIMGADSDVKTPAYYTLVTFGTHAAHGCKKEVQYIALRRSRCHENMCTPEFKHSKIKTFNF